MFVPFFYGVPIEEVKARVTTAAQQALDLDSTLADPHTAMAILYVGTGQLEKSYAESERAIALEPDNFEAHLTYGRNLTHAGRLADALEHFAQAKELEPVSPLLSAWTSYALYLNGQTDSAWKGIEQAMSLDSTLLPVINAGSLVSHGDGSRRCRASADGGRAACWHHVVQAVRVGEAGRHDGGDATRVGDGIEQPAPVVHRCTARYGQACNRR